MSVVAVAGECATTLSVGLAGAWPDPCIVAELDPQGGALAAWLDVTRAPNLSSLAADARQASWAALTDLAQRSTRGVEAVVLPAHPPEARAVVATLVPVLGSVLRPPPGHAVIVDAGDVTNAVALAPAVDVVVIAHRQRAATAATAALGIERVAGTVATLAAAGQKVVVALIGERPYRATDVSRLLDAAVVPIAVDAWAAEVLAGRPAGRGRFARSPLARSIDALAHRVVEELAVDDPARFDAETEIVA